MNGRTMRIATVLGLLARGLTSSTGRQQVDTNHLDGPQLWLQAQRCLLWSKLQVRHPDDLAVGKPRCHTPAERQHHADDADRLSQAKVSNDESIVAGANVSHPTKLVVFRAAHSAF